MAPRGKPKGSRGAGRGKDRGRGSGRGSDRGRRAGRSGGDRDQDPSANNDDRPLLLTLSAGTPAANVVFPIADLSNPQVLSSERRETGRSYFDAHSASGVRTSADTLQSVRLPAEAVLTNAMRDLPPHVSEDVERALVNKILRKDKLSKYAFWMAAGHSLLFYGFGSKIAVLDALAQKLADDAELDETAVFVMHGYNPSLSLRTALSEMATAVVPKTALYAKRHLLDYVRAIRDALTTERQTQRRSAFLSTGRVFLVVHNIDGVSLRSSDAQNVLSELAAIEGVSVIASIDHVNAPILWDGTMYARFRWAWLPATTFMRYTEEVVFGARPLLHGRNERRVEAAGVVLKSLSLKARKIFRLLAEFQCGRSLAVREDVLLGPAVDEHERNLHLDSIADGDASDAEKDTNGGRPRKRQRLGGASLAATHASRHDQSIATVNRTTFNDFYNQCRGKFLASDPASLKTMLTELETHDLLDRRKAADAAEQLWIPLTAQQLEEIVLNLDIVDN
jgi:origin recognition complex subunit 2